MFLSILGGIAGAVGNIVQGQAQAKADRYQAAVARNNRIIALNNAKYEIQAGAVEEQAQRAKTSAALGTARAIQGASGIDITSPSFANTRGTIASLGELDARTIRANAARKAYAYKTEGSNFEAQARLDEMNASSAQTAGLISAAGSIIGGASSVADKWLPYRTNPITYSGYTAAPAAPTVIPLLSKEPFVFRPDSYWPEFG